jgi:hypothetical protein
MPGQLEQNLAGILNSTEIAGIYGAITTAVSYTGTPAFDGIVSRPHWNVSTRSVVDLDFHALQIASYDYVMKVLLIAATCLAWVFGRAHISASPLLTLLNLQHHPHRPRTYSSRSVPRKPSPLLSFYSKGEH